STSISCWPRSSARCAVADGAPVASGRIVAVHLIGSGRGGVVEIGAPVRFCAVLRVHGAASPDGTLASARVSCPRKGCVDGAECIDCVHLQAFRAAPEARLY